MKHARTLSLALGLAICLAVVLTWPSRRTNETSAAPDTGSHLRAAVGAPLRESAVVEPPVGQTAAGAEERRVASGRVRGRFVDFHTGESIEGAVFHARHEQGVSHSDEGGEFQAFLGGGSIEFEAGADGYCVVRGELVAAELDSPGSFELPLVAASPIRGVVVDLQGAPVAMPYVYTVAPALNELSNPTPDGYPEGWQLFPEGLGGLMGREDGTFELAGLVPGATGFELKVTRSGFQKKTLDLFVQPAGMPTRVHVALRRNPRPPSGVITGRVYLNEQPIQADVRLLRGARVSIADFDFEERFYSLKAPPCSGTLLTLPASWEVDRDVYVLAPWITGSMTDLVVNDGDEIVQDVWMSMDVGTISGRVTNADGTAFVADIVAISPLVRIWAETDDDGRYAVEVPATGHGYRIQVGQAITSPSSVVVAPGTSAVDLQYGSFPSFTLTALDTDNGRGVTIRSVSIRRSGSGEDWFYAPGPPYKGPAGPLDIRVRCRSYRTIELQVHLAPGDENHFVANLSNL
jgi:hypothetical protein